MAMWLESTEQEGERYRLECSGEGPNLDGCNPEFETFFAFLWEGIGES